MPEHGIGRYEGLTIINSAGGDHDCLHLVYSGAINIFAGGKYESCCRDMAVPVAKPSLTSSVVLHGRRVLPASKAAFGLWLNSLSRLRGALIVRAPNL